MEIIDGISLQDRIDQAGSLELKEILRIGMQIAEGLAAAHKQGLIHRDIKPGNILLENGVQRVKITDFGLARLADDAGITQSGVIAGTPMYMAPEQAQGEHLDHRADLFSLGSVLYVLATGRPPFRAKNTVAVLKRVCEQTPRPIREINPEIPDWLSDIIEKLHTKEANDRYQTARKVADVLGEKLAELQFNGRAKSRRGEKPSKRSKVPETMIASEPAAPAAPKRSMLVVALLAVLATILLGAGAVVLAILFWPGDADVLDPAEKKNLVAEKKPPVVPVVAKDEWVQLFNGKDLTGWKHASWTANHWKVENGLLVAYGGRAILISETTYKDFRCRMEAKISPDAWGNLAFRAGGAEESIATPVSLIPNRTGGIWQLGKTTKCLFDPDNPATITADTWVNVDIAAKGNTVSIDINGTSICTKTIDRMPESGNLMLTQANPAGVFTIRKIEIKDLSANVGDKLAKAIAKIKLVHEFPIIHKGPVRGLQVSQDGGRVLSTTGVQTANNIVFWKLGPTGGEVIDSKTVLSNSYGMAMAPAGDFAVVGRMGEVQFWDLKKMEVINSSKLHSSMVWGVAVSPDGKQALTGGHGDNFVCLWELATGKLLKKIDVGTKCMSITYSPDGNTAVFAGYGGRCELWDLKSGKLVRAFLGQNDHISSVAISKDGKRLLTGSSGKGSLHIGDPIFRLWDIETGRQIQSFKGHTNQVWSVHFLADGQHILSGSFDGTMRIWSTSTGEEVARVHSEKLIFNCLALTPDERHVITAGGENYTDDGKFQVTGDYALRLWRLPENLWPIASQPDKLGNR